MQSGETALFWAATKGYDNIVQMLVDHGAAVDLGRDEVINLLGYHFIIIPCTYARGRVIGLSIYLSIRGRENHQILRFRHLSELKAQPIENDWLQFPSNRLGWTTNPTNRAFFVDHTYRPHHVRAQHFSAHACAHK